MNEYGIMARLAVLEILSVTCFTFILASAADDPDLSRAKAILNALNADVDQGVKYLPADAGQKRKRI